MVSSFRSFCILEQPGYLTGWKTKSAHTGCKFPNIRTLPIHTNITHEERYKHEQKNIDSKHRYIDFPKADGSKHIQNNHRDCNYQIQCFSSIRHTLFFFHFFPFVELPNDLCINRIAEGAGFGTLYLFQHRRTYQRRPKSEGQVGCTRRLDGSYFN